MFIPVPPGFIPNRTMQKDLKHMVDELQQAKDAGMHVPKVVIAVLDTGIWENHPLLKVGY